MAKTPEAIKPKLMKLLACPSDHSGLALEKGRLRCRKCGRRYEVKEGIPVFV